MTDIRNQIPGYLNPFDRSKGYKSLAFKHSEYLGAHELNHVQDIQRDALARIGSAVLANGAIISGGVPLKSPFSDDAGLWHLPVTEIFLVGSIHDVPAADLVIPSTGAHTIGVRLVDFTADCSVDPNLKGIAPGTRAEGEKMADAYGQIATWGWDSDGEAGDFFPVYPIQDGDLIREAASPQNDAFSNLVRLYDRDRNGHYVVEGCTVTALGLESGEQVFSIGSGTVNVYGYKWPLPTSQRHRQPEEPDLLLIENEPHSLTGAAPFTIKLSYAPLAVEAGKSPATVMVSRQKTVTMKHGAYSGIADGLPDPTVFRIVSVRMGANTYREGADYLLSGATIDWSPPGAEPAPGDTYQVVYQYTATVAPDAFTASTVTINDGVEGSVAYVTYRYKMPRWDAITIDRDGKIGYVKGVSSRLSPQKAYVGGPVMKLADIWNVWGDKPAIISTVDKRITVAQERDMEARLSSAEILIAELRLKNDISSRDPVAKRGLFADPLIDDTYRDQGRAQTAAVFGGAMVLPISAKPVYLPVAQRMLPYTDEVIVEQGFITTAMKINPYQAFPAPVPAVTLDPAVDVWSVTDTVWTSEVTSRFYQFTSYYWDPVPGNGPAGHSWSTSTSTTATSELFGTTTVALETIRERDVGFVLTNFGANETLTEVLFDGVPAAF